jgi:DNA-binding MarR family transcriptional regulator
MAGTGDWKKCFPDPQAYSLYEHLYRHPRRVETLAKDLGIPQKQVGQIVDKWLEAGFAKALEGGIVGQVPIFMDSDYEILAPWFDYVIKRTNEVINKEKGKYLSLAESISKRQRYESIDNILTILICAYTLDIGTLERLMRGIMGSQPKRGDSGHYFFWGRKTDKGPTYGFGVNTYDTGKEGKWLLSVIHGAIDRSPIWDFFGELRNFFSKKYGDFLAQIVKLLGELAEKPRSLEELLPIISMDKEDLKRVLEAPAGIRMISAKEPYNLKIPVFDEAISKEVKRICDRTSGRIAEKLERNLELLRALLKKCSFSHCPFGDVFCMVFHEGYGHATDKLIREGTIQAFPSKAAAEWGVWLWRQGA